MHRGRNREPITVEVHYPTTEEGWREYKEAQKEFFKIQVSILEKHFGEKKVAAVFEYMKQQQNTKV